MYPWSSGTNEQTQQDPQKHCSRIEPPIINSKLNFKTINTKFMRNDTVRKYKTLPEIQGAKETTDAFKEFDEFCEKEIVVFDDGVVETNYPKIDKLLTESLVDKRVAKNLNAFRIEELNALQRCTIPKIREGKSTLVFAPTGIGKTYAFLIPAIEKALAERKKNPPKGKVASPSVLIMSNTGRLVKQSFSRCCQAMGLVSDERVVPIKDIELGCLIADYRFNGGQCDIVFASMGKLEATMKEGAITFDNLKLFILDEADKMTDTGAFGIAVLNFVDNLPQNVRENLQTCLFSATFQITQDLLDLNEVEKKLLGPNPVQIYCPPKPGYITQQVIRLPQYKFPQLEIVMKMAKLQSIIDADLRETNCKKEGPYEQTIIIFCETIQLVNHVATALRLSGYNFKPMSRWVTKAQQDLTLKNLAFKNIHGVVCTNLMSRGIDIQSIRHTIVMEMSSDFATYKHRIGRVGRDGAGGKATIFISDEDLRDGNKAWIVENLYGFLKESNQEVPEWLQEFIDVRDRINAEF